MSNLGSIIEAVIVLMLVAYLFPTAIVAVYGTVTSTWTTAAKGIWAILPLMCVVVAILMVIAPAIREF